MAIQFKSRRSNIFIAFSYNPAGDIAGSVIGAHVATIVTGPDDFDSDVAAAVFAREEDREAIVLVEVTTLQLAFQGRMDHITASVYERGRTFLAEQLRISPAEQERLAREWTTPLSKRAAQLIG